MRRREAAARRAKPIHATTHRSTQVRLGKLSSDSNRLHVQRFAHEPSQQRALIPDHVPHAQLVATRQRLVAVSARRRRPRRELPARHHIAQDLRDVFVFARLDDFDAQRHLPRIRRRSTQRLVRFARRARRPELVPSFRRPSFRPPPHARVSARRRTDV